MMTTPEIKIVTVRESESTYFTRSPSDVKAIWDNEITKASWYDNEKEMFVVFCLNAKNRVKSYSLVSLGILDESLVHPREVFRSAIINSAKAIIVAHNHPSSDTTPSAEDIRVTKQLVEASKILAIPVADHVIMGKDSMTSMREIGVVSF